jgi:hypothetical protein
MADPAFGFGSRQSRDGETDGEVFCETNPISSAAIEAPLRTILRRARGAMILKTMESPVIAQAAASW